MSLLLAWLFASAAAKPDQAGGAPDLSLPIYPTERLKNLRMTARDGAILVADALRPRGRGRFPAILERTPFGREEALAHAEYWASRGYVYVAQDCRGRGRSGGTWDPFVGEGPDGADAVEWVARQPWCDGNVGMIGASYSGAAVWQAAVECPPALRCVAPRFALPDGMHGLPYEYGTFALQRALRWSEAFARPTVRTDAPGGQSLLWLPLGEALAKSNAIDARWLERTTLRDWKGFDYLDRLAEASVPALHLSDRRDENGIGTMLAWEAMRRAGRKDQWLVYGPGAAADLDVDALTLRFFETYLKGRSVGMEDVPRVQAFVAGADRWVALDGWPATNVPLETRYLAPGALVKSPGGAGAVVYTYDPAKERGKVAPKRVETVLPRRGSYALFKGEPFAKATAVAGPFETRLFFKSGARDTDFFASLIDLAPNGAMRAIGAPGKLRASYRDGLSGPALLEPGRIYAALIRPWDAAYELPKGHRLGLLVTSSMFPAYARNLGTGEPLATGKRTAAQRNVILTGTITPSRITYRRLW